MNIFKIFIRFLCVFYLKKIFNIKYFIKQNTSFPFVYFTKTIFFKVFKCVKHFVVIFCLTCKNLRTYSLIFFQFVFFKNHLNIYKYYNFLSVSFSFLTVNSITLLKIFNERNPLGFQIFSENYFIKIFTNYLNFLFHK